MEFNKRFDKETAKEYIAHMESEFGYISQAIDIINEVATEFNGKSLTIRFWRTINARLAEKIGTREVKYDDRPSKLLNIISITPPSASKYVSFLLFDRGFTLSGGRQDVIYLDKDFTYKIYDLASQITNDDNHISADNVKAVLERFNDDKHKTLAKYKDALQNWDEYICKAQKLNELICKNAAEINPLFINWMARNLDGRHISYLGKKF